MCVRHRPSSTPPKIIKYADDYRACRHRHSAVIQPSRRRKTERNSTPITDSFLPQAERARHRQRKSDRVRRRASASASAVAIVCLTVNQRRFDAYLSSGCWANCVTRSCRSRPPFAGVRAQAHVDRHSMREPLRRHTDAKLEADERRRNEAQ